MQFDIQGDIAFLQRAGVLKQLLKDRTTGRNILWGTDAYGSRGPEYARDQEMEIVQIVGENLGLLKTRAQKAAEQQTERTRQHAEVFTPAWICRMMNDQADREWFGRENVFFLPDGTPTERVEFKRKSWKRYVDSKRLEITCGEAPYLVSRYDVSSGEPIPLDQRVGMLDRKLRVVNENTDTEADWLKWAFRAFEATYGYEFQGDNLLIARVNLMMTFAEALDARWHREPTEKEWQRLSRIVTWNIWQMDGLTYTLPYAKGHELIEQTDFLLQFGFPPIQDERQPACRVYLWRYLKASMAFQKIREGVDGMKFDFIIGNPPYQEDVVGDNKTFAAPISEGHAYDMSTNIFDRLPQIFFSQKPDDGNEYIQILGRINNERVYKYIRSDYVNRVANLNYYKLVLPSANGNGTFGETLSNPVIDSPMVGSTETFISIGKFENRQLQ